MSKIFFKTIAVASTISLTLLGSMVTGWGMWEDQWQDLDDNERIIVSSLHHAHIPYGRPLFHKSVAPLLPPAEFFSLIKSCDLCQTLVTERINLKNVQKQIYQLEQEEYRKREKTEQSAVSSTSSFLGSQEIKTDGTWQAKINSVSAEEINFLQEEHNKTMHYNHIDRKGPILNAQADNKHVWDCTPYNGCCVCMTHVKMLVAMKGVNERIKILENEFIQHKLLEQKLTQIEQQERKRLEAKEQSKREKEELKKKKQAQREQKEKAVLAAQQAAVKALAEKQKAEEERAAQEYTWKSVYGLLGIIPFIKYIWS